VSRSRFAARAPATASARFRCACPCVQSRISFASRKDFLDYPGAFDAGQTLVEALKFEHAFFVVEAAGINLHEPHAALDQPARPQALRGEVCAMLLIQTVKLLNVLRLALNIERFKVNAGEMLDVVLSSAHPKVGPHPPAQTAQNFRALASWLCLKAS